MTRSQENPYRPPQIETPAEQPRVSVSDRGDASGRRLFAAAVDNLLATVLSLIIAVLLVPPTAVRGVAVCVVYFFYFLLLEGMWSGSIGKWLFGLRVVQTRGGQASWSSAFVRTLLRIVEVNPLLLGGLPAGLVITFSKRNQRLGDLLAGTVVVSTR